MPGPPRGHVGGASRSRRIPEGSRKRSTSTRDVAERALEGAETKPGRHSRRLLERPSSRCVGLLGRSWRLLGGSGAVLALPGRASGRSRLLLDRSGALLDGPGRLPGPILTALGRLLGRSRRLLTGCSSALGGTELSSGRQTENRRQYSVFVGFGGSPGVFVRAPGKLSAAHGALLASLKELRASLGPAGAAPGVAWSL